MTGRGEHGVIRWMRVTVNPRVTVAERALSRGGAAATRGLPTCDASRGQGQAERDVVLVVAHLSQEFKFQLTQDLACCSRRSTSSVRSHIRRKQEPLPGSGPCSLTGCSCSYLAVCRSDHVYKVADELEREASVHQSETALQRGRGMEIRPPNSITEGSF